MSTESVRNSSAHQSLTGQRLRLAAIEQTERPEWVGCCRRRVKSERPVLVLSRPLPGCRALFVSTAGLLLLADADVFEGSGGTRPIAEVEFSPNRPFVVTHVHRQ